MSVIICSPSKNNNNNNNMEVNGVQTLLTFFNRIKKFIQVWNNLRVSK